MLGRSENDAIADSTEARLHPSKSRQRSRVNVRQQGYAGVFEADKKIGCAHIALTDIIFCMAIVRNFKSSNYVMRHPVFHSLLVIVYLAI
ncbi:hypothetical protein PUN28_016670 [Cardiocondyla obscurior]|uniref:Uncharacterized protein n=1 Tax=Cardiocondyla obscurior TaxID=286306 RepID=A0AAW2EU16_9HYME